MKALNFVTSYLVYRKRVKKASSSFSGLFNLNFHFLTKIFFGRFSSTW